MIAVEPTESPVLAGGKPSGHKIQGIGAGFIPANADTSLFNEIVHVSGDEAIAMARGVAVDEGLFVGISAGAAIASAIRIGQRPENAGKNIVVIIPSHGERYLSSALFAELHAEALSQPLEPAECITVDLGSAAQPASK